MDVVLPPKEQDTPNYTAPSCYTTEELFCQNCYNQNKRHTFSDNKVRELATVCLPWQHWTKALVWFYDVDTSAFHSCVVVDLWRSLSEWHLLLSVCV